MAPTSRPYYESKFAHLGGSSDSFTLNFSRPATGVYVQFYKFLRLGTTGYRRVCDNMMAVAARIRKGLKELKRADGTPYVQLLDAGDTKCLPVVTARVNPALNAPYGSVSSVEVASMASAPGHRHERFSFAGTTTSTSSTPSPRSTGTSAATR